MSVSNLFRKNDYNIFCNDFTVDGNLSYDGSLTFEEININGTTESSSTSTGALIVSGGIGVAQQLNVYNVSIYSTSKGSLGVSGGALIAGDVSINSTTVSNSTATGSLTVAGGVGIASDLRVGGTIYGTVNGTVSTTSLQLTDTTGSISTSTGTLTVGGGVGIGENLYVGKNLNVLGSNIYTATNYLHLESPSNKVYLKGTSYFQNPSDTTKYFSISTDSGGNTNLKSWGTNSYTYYDSTNYLRVDSSIDASPSPTGALQLLNGGLYVGKSVYINGTMRSTSTSTGALQVYGGVGIASDVNIGGNVNVTGTISGNVNVTSTTNLTITNTTNSTNPTTGALIVNGGVGIVSDVYIGGSLNLVGTSDSTDLYTGSLIVNGGSAISKNLNIGENVNMTFGQMNIGEISPIFYASYSASSVNADFSNG